MTKLQKSRAKTFLFLTCLAGAVSMAFLGFLSKQMAEGKDPVLAQKRPVVHKKITQVKRIVEPRKTVYIKVPATKTTYSAPSSSAPTYSAPTYSEPTYTAPTYTAPTYTAPVVSSAS